MKYIPDAVSNAAQGSPSYVPVCIDCICAYCKKKCEMCRGDTDTGYCVKNRCVKDEKLDY